MRPYVIEVCFAFAAGMCVGAYLNEKLKTEKAVQEPIMKQEPAGPKKGVMVTMQDGKIIIDPSRRKRWFRK